MKATELRIGNVLLLNENLERIYSIVPQTIPVDGISLKEGDLPSDKVKKEVLINNIEIEQYSPIPITMDWLLALGFKQTTLDQNVYHYWKNYAPDGFNKIKVRISWFRNEEIHNLPCISKKGEKDIRFNYVHQLQNLYFEFTGEELELKE